MNSRERVLGAFNRTGYDRIPVKHEGTPEINQMIMDHYGLSNMEQVLRVVGDDFRYVVGRRSPHEMNFPSSARHAPLILESSPALGLASAPSTVAGVVSRVKIGAGRGCGLVIFVAAIAHAGLQPEAYAGGAGCVTGAAVRSSQPRQRTFSAQYASRFGSSHLNP